MTVLRYFARQLPSLRDQILHYLAGEIRLRQNVLQETPLSAEHVSWMIILPLYRRVDVYDHENESADVWSLDRSAFVFVMVWQIESVLKLKLHAMSLHFAEAGLLSMLVMSANVESAIISLLELDSHSNVSSCSCVCFTSTTPIT